MEKRFVSFIVLSMLILVVFQIIDARLNPRPEQPEQVAGLAENEVAEDDVVDVDGENGAEDPAKDQSTTSTTPSRDVKPEVTAADLNDETATESRESQIADPAAFSADPARVAIGSLDPESPIKLLAWFTSEGASIECIALNDRRYGDLERRHGYLGFLGLEEMVNGLKVTVVGQGTPADRAQLKAGDVIVKFGQQPVGSVAEYQQWLETTKPGQQVDITVNRSGSQDVCSATLRKYPLQVIRPEWRQAPGTAPGHPHSYRLGVQQLGATTLAFDQQELPGLPSLKSSHWRLERDPDDPLTIEFHYLLTGDQLQAFNVAGPLRFIKRFRIADSAPGVELDPDDDNTAAYHLTYELEIRNESESGEATVAYQQDGPTGLPLEGWWYTYKTHPTSFGGAGVRDVVTEDFRGDYKMFTNPDIVSRLEENPESPAISMYADEPPNVLFAGVDAQYFVSAIIADVQGDDRATEDYLFQDALAVPIPPQNEVKRSLTDVTFRLVSRPIQLTAGESYTQRFLVFAGPKRSELLANYGLGDCITYGWFPLIAKPLMWILHAFHAVFRNYGIAIVLLTVLVRSCMFPIGRSQALNAQKMQELAPEMKQIAEKYKNDMEKRAAAQRELFQKHNYNPLAGCLPMFIQLPIFIGLYRALSVDISLRQAPLIPGLRWCANLAGPDQFLNWQGFMPGMLADRTGWLGPYLNVLPLITVALMVVHQKLFTPPPTDEQQEMQQKLMKYMMLFFGFMFFRVPAGLCLYFITSNLWSVGERKLLPKRSLPTKPDATKANQVTKSARAVRAKKRR